MRKSTVILWGLVAALAAFTHDETQAAEDAAGFYLLGSKGSMAGFLPPPGTYFVDLGYYYSGDAQASAAASIALRQAGKVTVQANLELDAEAYFNIPTVIWVAPEKVLGGNAGFGVMVPVGWKKIDVDLDVLATLTLPNGTTLQAGREFNIGDDSTAFGDPVLNATLGWHQGNWHWNVGTLLNVPIGQWDEDKIANIGFNRWALDTNAAVTWLDMTSGLEVSGAVGFTFNWENPDTDYKTGTEFHAEWAIVQHFSKTFALGLAGYHYQQVSGDSGSGAVLGDFEGRVTALGPVMTFSFELGKIPVNTEVKWLHEFDVENRLEGDAGLLTVSMPLSVVGH